MARAGVRKGRARTFFIKQEEERQEGIREHVKTLFQRFENRRPGRGLVASTVVREDVSSYEFKTQLLQHLLTAHKETYDAYVEAEEITRWDNEGNPNKLRNALIEKLREAVWDKAKDMGIKTVTGSPARNELSCGDPFEFAEQVGVQNLQFEAKQDPNSREAFFQVVYAGDKVFAYCQSDEEKAKTFAKALNDIIADKTVLEKARVYHQTEDRLTELDGRFNSQFRSISNHILLDGVIDTSNQACEACLGRHKDEDKERLKAALAV